MSNPPNLPGLELDVDRIESELNYNVLRKFIAQDSNKLDYNIFLYVEHLLNKKLSATPAEEKHKLNYVPAESIINMGILAEVITERLVMQEVNAVLNNNDAEDGCGPDARSGAQESGPNSRSLA